MKSKNLKAIIVAGGRGERLRPITDMIPKPMVEVRGKTILEHTIDLLKKNGINDLVIALCYLPGTVTNYFGDGEKFGVKIQYTFEDPLNPLGTAGAIRASKKFINDDVIVTYADILRELNIREMIRSHQSSGALATLNIYKEFEEIPRSMLKVGNNNELIEFVEHPEIKNTDGSFVWCNGSFYIFKKEIFDYIDDNGKVDFSKDIFPKVLNKHITINTFKSDGYFLDIGTMEKLLQARNTYPG